MGPWLLEFALLEGSGFGVSGPFRCKLFFVSPLWRPGGFRALRESGPIELGFGAQGF